MPQPAAASIERPADAVRPRVVAVRIWDWSEWCRQVVRGVQKFAHDRPHWRLYVDVSQTRRLLVNTQELRLDGIVTHVLHDIPRLQRLARAGRTKVVSFAASVPVGLSMIPRVRVDDLKVAEVIGRHLSAGGFRRLAYCGGDAPLDDRDPRHEAVQAYATTLGYPYDVYAQRPRKVVGIRMPTLTRWLAKLPKPVGIVAWNIEVARRLIQAAAAAKIAVPDQVAIVAWDDDPMLAETLEPTISAAVLPAERLGFEAARLLDQVMEGATVTRPVMIDPSGVLRVRGSSDVSALADREVHLALQFIREHAAGPIKIPQVADFVRVSRKKLELDFTRVVGQTPYEAVLRARLDLAKKYLLETDWDLGKVADRSGLGDKSTLRRQFVRRENLTPGQFRTQFGLVRV